MSSMHKYFFTPALVRQGGVWVPYYYLLPNATPMWDFLKSYLVAKILGGGLVLAVIIYLIFFR